MVGMGRQRKREEGGGGEEMLCRVRTARDPGHACVQPRAAVGGQVGGPGGRADTVLSDLCTSGRGALFAGGSTEGSLCFLRATEPMSRRPHQAPAGKGV